MERYLSCEVCRSEYNVDVIIPNVLKCGHSICLPCVTKIVQNASVCPKCRRTISDINSLPTNLFILELVEALKSPLTVECDRVGFSVIAMKDKYLQGKDMLLKARSEMESSLNVIDKGLDKINELITGADRNDISKVKGILRKLQEDFETKIDYGHFNIWKSKNCISFSFGSFDSPEDYLTKIYQRLKNEEKIFGVKSIADQVRFGEVSVCDNKLTLHSLTLTKVPENSSFIWFDELKQCLGSNLFRPFIIISRNENALPAVNFELFKNHLSNQFIKLCTGECGQSYKGDILYEREDQMGFQVSIRPKMMTEYIYSENEIETKICCKRNEYYLKLTPSGSFHLIKTVLTGENTFHGKVISPANLNDITDCDVSCYKIIDCGIVLYV